MTPPQIRPGLGGAADSGRPVPGVPAEADGRATLAAVLRHDAKTTTYKFALVRALNDLALEFPWSGGDVVVPLRRIAERWLVSYWPFVGPTPVWQGARATRGGIPRQDLSFRPALTALRSAWDALPGSRPDPAGGALLLADLRVGRGRLPPDVVALAERALSAIAVAVRQPVRFAGPGRGHGVFGPPAPAAALAGHPLPGTSPGEVALRVPAALWRTLTELSLWVEALCLQQWSLFLERVAQTPAVSRGEAFTLLTATPAGRVPLTWERHEVRLLLLGGVPLRCPWTGTLLDAGRFDLDHVVPLSAHPINELWNLVPSDPQHNMHVKRGRIPSAGRLQLAQPRLADIYAAYQTVPGLASGLGQDVSGRFGRVWTARPLAAEVIRLTEAVAQARNVPRY